VHVQFRSDISEITLDRDPAFELAYYKYTEILHITKSHLYDYSKIKPGLQKIQEAVHDKNFPDAFERIKEYLADYVKLSKYFGLAV